jgi:hypothetical protein
MAFEQVVKFFARYQQIDLENVPDPDKQLMIIPDPAILDITLEIHGHMAHDDTSGSSTFPRRVEIVEKHKQFGGIPGIAICPVRNNRDSLRPAKLGRAAWFC